MTEFNQTYNILAVNKFRRWPIGRGRIWSTFKALIVIVSQRNRNSHTRESKYGCGGRLASAPIHNSSLMLLGKDRGREVRKYFQCPGVKNRKLISQSNHRALADFSAR